MKYCSHCGESLLDDASFCPKCGCTVGSNLANNPNVSADMQNALNTNSENVSPKSRLAAFLFAFFLGGFGIHNFYLGHTAKGVIQLILTLTLIGAIVTGIWVFIEWIMILCGSSKDGQGRDVKKW